MCRPRAVSQGPAIRGHCPPWGRSRVPGGWAGLGAAQGSVVSAFSFVGRGVSGSFLNLVAESQKHPSMQMRRCSCVLETLFTTSWVPGVAQRPWLTGSARQAAEFASFAEGPCGDVVAPAPCLHRVLAW